MFLRRRPASVQAWLLDLEAIRDDVLLLKGGDTRAVVEATGVDLALKSAEEQDAILDGYRALLNGLDGPVQLVAHSTPQDVQAYLDGLRARPGVAEPEALVRLRLDHFAFVQALAARRTLLQHRAFLVIAGPRIGSERRAGGLLGFLRRGDREPAADFDAARRQLAARSEELRQGLQAIGLPARRLGREDLVALLHEVLAPQQAARQRLGATPPPAAVVRAWPAETEVPHVVAA